MRISSGESKPLIFNEVTVSVLLQEGYGTNDAATAGSASMHEDQDSSEILVDESLLMKLLQSQEAIARGSRSDRKHLKLPEGDYFGEELEGKPHGFGTLTYSPDHKTREEYEGFFVNGLFEGKGTMTYRSSSGMITYEGGFKKGLRHGDGILILRNGDAYKCKFENDVIEGLGTVIYNNGNKYVGNFRNGVRDGVGVFILANGERYDGTWQANKKHGRGTYQWPCGQKYSGEYKEDRIEGEGVLLYDTGSKDVGVFKNGKLWNGVRKYPGGTPIDTTYANGKTVIDSCCYYLCCCCLCFDGPR